MNAALRCDHGLRLFISDQDKIQVYVLNCLLLCNAAMLMPYCAKGLLLRRIPDSLTGETYDSGICATEEKMRSGRTSDFAASSSVASPDRTRMERKPAFTPAAISV